MRTRPERFGIGGRLLAVAVIPALLGGAVPWAGAPPPTLAAGPAVTALYVDGPGSFVAGTATYLTDATTSWSATLSGDGNVLDIVVATPGSPGLDWFIQLAAPAGQSLAAGAYPGAVYPQEPGAPSLLVGRGVPGCSPAFGSFSVAELSVSAGVVTALAISIEHHCGAPTDPPIWLDLRFASAVPLQALLYSAGPLAFGDQVTGHPTDARTIEVVATGTAAATVSSVAIEGPQAADFAVGSDTCTGVTLAPGSTCHVGVTFTPASTAWREATLTVASTTVSGSHGISLTGSGVAYGLSTRALDFGSQPVWTTASRTITFLNGSEPRTLAGFNVEWYTIDSPNPYTVRASSGCTASPNVPALGSCDITVDFTPQLAGSNTAMLLFMVGSDTMWVQLSGVGIAASKVAWGPARTVHGAGWTSGKALARTAASSVTYLHGAVTTNNNGAYLGIYYRRTSTNGKTWAKPVRLNPAKQHADRAAVAATGSRVYVAWVSQTKWARYSPTAPRVIYVRSNATHGSGSWGTIRRVTSLTGRVDYPAIAASGKSVYVAFTDASTGVVKLAISRDRGRTWATKKLGTTALSAGKEGRAAMPSVSAYGSLVIVAWTADRYGKVVVKISSSAGKTWSSSTPTTAAQGYAATAAASGRLVVAWPVAQGLRLRTWRSSGWGPVVTASSPGVPGTYAWTDTGAVALSGSAQVAAAWVGCRSKCSSDWPLLDIVWAESRDGGATFPFRQVAVVGADSGASYPQNYSPSVTWASSTTRALMYFATFQFETWSTHLRVGTGSPN